VREVGLRGGEVFLRCRRGVLSADEVQQLRAAEDEVKELLRLVDGPSEANRLDWFRTCENLLKRLEGVSSPYPFQWNGDQLRGTEVALDCETTLVQGEEVPDLVLVAVSDGQRSFVLQPQQLGPFLELHRSRKLRLSQHRFRLSGGEEVPVGPCGLVEVADEGRLRRHDAPGHADFAGRVGRLPSTAKPRTGGEAVGWNGTSTSPTRFRTRFSELIGADWGQVDPGFFEYAVRDAEATVRSWKTMKTAAKKFRTTDRFGLLTEHLQTLAAVALAEITSNGMELDLDLVKRNRGAFAKRLQDLTAQLRNLPEAAGLLQTCRQRTLFAAEAEVGRPSFNQKRLRAILRRIAEDRDLSPPTTGKTGNSRRP
jgi:hypothetical protein